MNVDSGTHSYRTFGKENKRERKRVRATMRVGLSVGKRWEM
jgi:hypothetical protein